MRLTIDKDTYEAPDSTLRNHIEISMDSVSVCDASEIYEEDGLLLMFTTPDNGEIEIMLDPSEAVRLVKRILMAVFRTLWGKNFND